MTASCPLFGFDVTLVPAAGADHAALHEDFLKDAIERDGLAAEASASPGGRFTVTRDGGQATDADRQAIAEWAAARPDIASCEVGPLVDLSPSA